MKMTSSNGSVTAVFSLEKLQFHRLPNGDFDIENMELTLVSAARNEWDGCISLENPHGASVRFKALVYAVCCINRLTPANFIPANHDERAALAAAFRDVETMRAQRALEAGSRYTQTAPVKALPSSKDAAEGFASARRDWLQRLRKQIRDQNRASFYLAELPSWQHKAMAYAVCVSMDVKVLDWQPAGTEQQQWVNDLVLWVGWH